ncbi:hypothetical protein HNO52_11470 [Billgrantia diversa]|uniref:hypothetical protein n=1 Tax=Halomonas sp. MCCC 1A13316 TaxID=2733487 RepID=UPI0018A4FF24|nr:hypothetical protein [Halomonas sp. MCCC 1A13316]QOR39062.1 hypothetical protein HNO52_11470 [Halomonas sp. MCCC 1A13316]
MTIQIHPLPGHPLLVEVREETRTPQELLCDPQLSSNTSSTGVMLMHPPVLMMQEGGGEKVLNKDALTAQLAYRKRDRNAQAPESLRVYIIDSTLHDPDFTLLLFLIFGRVQRMYYRKKEGKKPSWKSLLKSIHEDPHLKSTIEKFLFDGEELAPRHYQILLSAAQVGESSINHALGKIRVTYKKDSKKTGDTLPAKAPSKTPSKKSARPCKPTKAKTTKEMKSVESDKADKSRAVFNMAASLSTINEAAQRGAEQFALNIAQEDV